jgi:O-antigen/teichoic acid export membrane protein
VKILSSIKKIKGIKDFFPILLTSSVQSLIFISGLVINKCIAVYSGPTGIALFGIVKNFHVFFGSFLKLGSDTVIINAAAKSARDKEKEYLLLGAIFRLVFFQFVVVLFVLSFLDELIFNSIFSLIIPKEFSWLTRVILFLVLLSAISEMLISFFNGFLDYTKVFSASLFGTLSTLILALTIIPSSITEVTFLALSSGAFSSLALFAFLYKDYFGRFKINIRKYLFSNLPISTVLLVQPIVVSFTLLLIQQLIGKSYGVNSLAYFVLCWTLLGAGMTLMMSSVRMYFLPKLGAMSGHKERNDFFKKNVFFFILLAALALIFISFLSDFIIITLYSEEFLKASGFLVLLSSTLVLKSFEWIVAVSSWEKERYKFYIIPECLREIFYITSCFVLVVFEVDFIFIILGFVISDILVSLVWIGYLRFYKEELYINSFLILMIYIFTLIVVIVNFLRVL